MANTNTNTISTLYADDADYVLLQQNNGVASLAMISSVAGIILSIAASVYDAPPVDSSNTESSWSADFSKTTSI